MSNAITCIYCKGNHSIESCEINTNQTNRIPFCSRCERTGHNVINCYARRHINGQTLGVAPLGDATSEEKGNDIKPIVEIDQIRGHAPLSIIEDYFSTKK